MTTEGNAEARLAPGAEGDSGAGGAAAQAEPGVVVVDPSRPRRAPAPADPIRRTGGRLAVDLRRNRAPEGGLNPGANFKDSVHLL